MFDRADIKSNDPIHKNKYITIMDNLCFLLLFYYIDFNEKPF